MFLSNNQLTKKKKYVISIINNYHEKMGVLFFKYGLNEVIELHTRRLRTRHSRSMECDI